MGSDFDNDGKSWMELLTELRRSILEDGDDDDIDARVSDLSKHILSLSGSDGNDALPPSAKDAATAVHLRSLIRRGKYNDVVDFCSKNDLKGNTNKKWKEEEAYALYRTKKYAECRALCDSSTDDASRGLRHVHAQALFRLRETRAADEAYRSLITSVSPSSEDPEMDSDEWEDALANALANLAGNYTAGSMLSSKMEGCWVEEVDAFVDLLERYGGGGEGKEGEDGPGMMQNYDLAYNLATFLLVTSDARPLKEVGRARNVLVEAERSALTVLESMNADADADDDADDEDEDEAAKKKKKEAEEQRKKEQKEQAEKEAGPIRANLALARILLGGEDDDREAMRACLTLLTKRRGAAAGGGGIDDNLLAATSNNLAVLREKSNNGKESPLDAATRIPSVVASTSGASSTAGAALLGAPPPSLAGNGTPLQLRTALYNRALLLARAGEGAMCESALGELRASLAGGGGAGGKKKKERKKKGKSPAPSTQGGGAIVGAETASEAEAAAWKARADLVEAEMRRVRDAKKAGEGEGGAEGASGEHPSKKDTRRLLDAAIADLARHEDGAASYARAELLLYREVAAISDRNTPVPELLAALPENVRSRPGVVATLAAARGGTASSTVGGDDEKEEERLLASLGAGTPQARAAAAELMIARGKHGQAAEILEALLGELDGGTAAKGEAISESQILATTASLVAALSRSDPVRAAEFAERLPMPQSSGTELPDGEELESRGVPRFAKKASSAAAGGGEGGSGTSLQVQKIIAAAGRSNVGERKKKNHEAILRQRARKRELHLLELQKQGRYNPDRPAKPDPERWIPKSQRSYNRRGRRGRGRNGGGGGGVGAQGGGIGAGADKDAARLDVAARAAQMKAGLDGSGNKQPSTAHIVVSGGPTRRGKGGRKR